MQRMVIALVPSPPSLILNPRNIQTYQIGTFLLHHTPRSSPIISMSSWSCIKCTFLNPPSQKSQCQICSSSPPPSPPPSSSSSSPPKWSCKACTLLNPYKNSTCELCGTRSPVLSLSNSNLLQLSDDDDDRDSSVGSVFFPLRSCKRKFDSLDHAQPSTVATASSNKKKAIDFTVSVASGKDVASSMKILSSGKDVGTSLKILSYNVWFREDLELQKRMKAIGDLVHLHSPDLICFQEVTPNIYDIFKKSTWWSVYQCSVSADKAYSRPYFCMLLSKLPVKSFSNKSFSNSIMGRELCIAEVEAANGKSLVIATSHLESPCPGPPKWDQMYSKERVEQANEAVNLLKKHPNVVFGGDMNWDDKLDGQYPSQDGWIDAWSQLRPDQSGWTYDTKSNQMLSGNRTLQKRLDRFICRLSDLKISSIDMIGMDAIPGLSYIKEKKVRKETKQLVLPVLPSDHYGLLLTITSK
ncbi:uncharacterized protein LOC130715423 [Lotus japonicus]|uniref:uncharacterized protein LOC130715423 n=1 Tax=Lotus japonicus TaxID=34305 RepID=UPI00258AB9AB|nr:uncharacterized protein LOC130715423 [Lotus japonicus]